MTPAIDSIIETYEKALRNHRNTINSLPPYLIAIANKNNEIVAVRELVFSELAIPVSDICNDDLLVKLYEHRTTTIQQLISNQISIEKNKWKNLEKNDIRRVVAYVAQQSLDGHSWPTYENFLDILKLQDSILWKNHYNYCTHIHTMYIGKWAGWWELSWDVFPDNDEIELYNIALFVISKSETIHTHFPSLLAELKLFKSANEAKKNGWAKPLEIGDFFFKKKTYILRIVD